MKFLLVLHLCSVVTATCPNMMHPKKIYNSWDECAIAGYELSLATFTKLNKNEVNQHKLAIKFECKEMAST